MELKDYFDIINRRKWVIIIITVTAAIVVGIGTIFFIQPVYTATATIRVAPNATILGDSSNSNTDRLLNTFVEIANSTPVLSEIQNKLGKYKLPDIEVSVLPNTELIQISVTDPMPAMAAHTANILSDILVDKGKEYYNGNSKSPVEILKTQIDLVETELNEARKKYTDLVAANSTDSETIASLGRLLDLKQQVYGELLQEYEQTRLKEAVRSNIVSVVQKAETPLVPSSPKLWLNIALGFFVGMAGGIGTAIIIENLDTTLYSAEQIESLSYAAVLGRIPLSRNTDITSYGNTPFEEAFGHLSHKLLSLSQEKQLHSLLITSSEPGEGKSTIISNLAISLALTGKRVVLVDSNLRVPGLHNRFDVKNENGLADIIYENMPLKDVIQPGELPNLSLITSGTAIENPAKLLNSPRMKDLIDTLSKQYDLVLVDSPSLLPIADAAIVAQLVDEVLIVVRRGKTTRPALKLAFEQIADIKTKVLGLVINADNHVFQYNHYTSKN